MTARFTRLRIAGFKSFAEPVELEILPGLTGFVGPNGCGKSNVAEALRWVMGEASARSLRGGEMDDVIFAGTTTRASRNLAEVSITLGSEDGGLPPPFAAHAELQVIRRIERGGGSAYRVNGREARARDVQTLFADLASGARSSAMVSQGRIGAIVGARPEERRHVLEEAAGIGGLHARRAEAEGKLRAADANLLRAEDQRTALAAQLDALGKQAKQAARYRVLMTQVQEAEAALIHLRHARAAAAHAAARAAWEHAQAQVTQAASTAIAATAQHRAASGALPGLRQTEGAMRDAALRARVAQEGHAAEAARLQAALMAAAARAAQTRRDLDHAERAQHDADAADARLVAEAERLAHEAAQLPARLHDTSAEAEAARLALEPMETLAAAAAADAAHSAAAAQAAAQALMQADARLRRAQDAMARLEQESARAAQDAVPPERLQDAADAVQRADAALQQAATTLDAAERARAAALPASAAAREAQVGAEAVRAKLAAEAGALAEVLAVRDGERWPPMVDRVEVPPGLEAALGAALGEDLVAAGNPEAARHWRELPPFAADEGGLLGVVRGPPALARALGAVRLVADRAEGDARQAGLLAGQSLVSRDGALWRWDGYCVRAGAPTPAAVRLQQRNRLASVRVRLGAADAAARTAQAARQAAEAEERAATTAEAAARPARREADHRAGQARQAEAALRHRAAAADARLMGLQQQVAQLEPELAEASAAQQEAEAARLALPDPAQLRAEAERTRQAAAQARLRDNAAARALDALMREDAARTARRTVLSREREDWRMRAEDHRSRAADLRVRAADAAREHAALEAVPEQAGARAEAALVQLRQADAAHAAAAAALSAGEQQEAAAARAAQDADRALAAEREYLVRAEAEAGHAAQLWREQGDVTPIGPAPADLSSAAEERARARLDRMMRERDAIGPVNLLAEQEAAGIEVAMAAILRDRAELETAIAKLRGSIGHLNREGRERLAAVFQQVDRHFQALFTRMFGGGRAHLALVGSDDPLLAGLEIYAQPPGKKLAALSLLSGGEQALTALSLIFAVFRCNPAPVCVLDEVDAPLDDANVDRFCALLADMVAETGTRFLVVTHHQLTMARMDRLYGVTMQERGVSRLLSVDLGRAMAMVEQVAAE